MGFYLNPNDYSKRGWGWVISKVEKILSLWCNRWLSKGKKIGMVQINQGHTNSFGIEKDGGITSHGYLGRTLFHKRRRENGVEKISITLQDHWLQNVFRYILKEEACDVTCVNTQKWLTTSSTSLHGSFVHLPTIFP